MSELVDNSYQLGAFRDNQGSLHRLKRQASAVTDHELEHLLRAGLNRGQRVLDLGCGPGQHTLEIARKTAPRRLVAVDCNSLCLAEARRLLGEHYPSAEVRHGNAYGDLSDLRGGFDFIYSRLLFQHLSEPLRALLNVRELLEVGGRVCVCDVDDRWLSVGKNSPELTSFLGRARAAQRDRGGDREVGAKLPQYLALAGFTNIRSSTLLVSTDLLAKSAFCDLVFGFKLEILPEAELLAARAELRAVQAGIEAADGWAGMALFFVSAERA